MAEGGEGEGETGSDCGGQGPHYPEVPQIQASTVGGGRTESELTRGCTHLFHGVGLMQGR